MLETSYRQNTSGITIAVDPKFLDTQSSPEQHMYAFSYTIDIENYRSDTVQLLRRKWLVSSGGYPLTEVEGEGVVGLQPLIRPGERFRYTSGTIINHSVGSMHGTYIFVDQQGEEFDVAIPLFNLVYPEMLH